MKLLKFDGAALSSVENLYIIVALAQQANAKNKTIVVVSSKSEISNLLKEAANRAAAQNELYKEKLKAVEREYVQLVKELIPIVAQSAVLSRVKKMCNELENLCEGVFLVSELSAKVEDRIASYGEILSSYILSAKLQSLEIVHQWSNARELIQSNANLGLAGLSFSETANTIRSMVGNSDQQLFILPDISVAHHKFSFLVSKSFDLDPLEIVVEMDESLVQS
ncbi:MAG: amino acid kinase family protein [Bacteroidota bacterium]